MTTMTASPVAPTLTAEELYAMDNAVGYELVNGELKDRNVSKESSRITAKIIILLGQEAIRTGTTEIYNSELGYQCFPPGSFRNIRKPDVSLVVKSRLTALPRDFEYMPIPADLVVEVVSPNDMAWEVDEKLEEYLSAGFPLVWIVNPSTRTVSIHRADGSVSRLHERDEIGGESALPEFRCLVGELFT